LYSNFLVSTYKTERVVREKATISTFVSHITGR